MKADLHQMSHNKIHHEKYVVSINGSFFKAEDARISIFDHGFLFGDSVYEVVRTRGGRILAWQPHIDRLFRSANAIELPLPWSSDELKAHAFAVLNNCHWPGTEAYLRIIVTRGEGELTLDTRSCKSPNLILIAKPMPTLNSQDYDTGMVLELVNRQRNSKESTNPNVKSGNYLNNVLAFAEAKSKGAYEAIMLNAAGQLTECTTSNIFLVKSGIVSTPALHCGLLAGITRHIILETCKKAAIEFREAEIYPQDLWDADEVFISSSTRDIVPVCQVNSSRFDAPGQVTARLMNAFKVESESHLDSEIALPWFREDRSQT